MRSLPFVLVAFLAGACLSIASCYFLVVAPERAAVVKTRATVQEIRIRTARASEILEAGGDSELLRKQLEQINALAFEADSSLAR